MRTETTATSASIATATSSATRGVSSAGSAITIDFQRFPSHLTQAQTSRVIKKSKQTVYRLSLHGEALEAEKWFGTDMIPVERIEAYMWRPRGRRR